MERGSHWNSEIKGLKKSAPFWFDKRTPNCYKMSMRNWDTHYHGVMNHGVGGLRWRS